MRVLHVSPLYWPSLGGAEQVTQMLSERMAREGHVVTVLSSDAASVERFWSARAPRVTRNEERLNGVQVRRVAVAPFPLGRLSLFITRGLAIRLFDPLRLRKLVRYIGGWMPHLPQFRRVLNALLQDIDVVHAFNLSWESCLVDAAELAQQLGIPCVVTPFLHTGEAQNARVSRNYSMSHQRAALRSSARVIVQTPVEAQAIKLLGVDARRIVQTGVGIDPQSIAGGDAERFRARHDLHDPIVAFIGRVTHDKGATALVRALQKVWAEGHAVECVIAGLVLPDFARFWRTQTQTSGIHLLGPIDEDEKRDLLAAADVVVMPSRAESFGIVYLEAWAYAKPVIGARAGGAAEVIADGIDGHLVPFDDVEALARKLIDLLADRDRAEALGRAGQRKLFERYTSDIVYAKTLDIYHDVLATS